WCRRVIRSRSRVVTGCAGSRLQHRSTPPSRPRQRHSALSLPGSDTVALALQQGRVDAALNSTATIAAMTGENPDSYELAGLPFDANTKVGIALRKDETELKGRLNTALQDMVKDGTYAQLLKKWSLPAQSSAD